MREKVVYFTGCFSNYYAPGTGKALVHVMERNGFDVIVPEQKCCGMPMMANSNAAGARKSFNFNAGSLARAASSGLDVITTCPSCNMMLRREGLSFFESENARFIAGRVYDAAEYLYRLHRQGRLDVRFRELRHKVLYHNPCHLKVQAITEQPLALLKLVPGLDIVRVNTSCCGMGGSYGMKKQNYERSAAIAQKVWSEAKASGAEVVATECGGCGLQIEAGTGIKAVHPIVILSRAYGAAVEREAA